LRGAARRHVEEANVLVDFTVAAMRAQHRTSPGLSILEHPEDLGRTTNGTPGTVWQLEKVKELGTDEGVLTGALLQSEFGTAYSKPTRLLGRLPGLHDKTAPGWPSFDAEDTYIGPLPKYGTEGGPRSPQGTARLIGSSQGRFATAAAAAWPTPLCDWLARLVRDAVMSHQATASNPGEPVALTSEPRGSPGASDPSEGSRTVDAPGLAASGKPIRRRITAEEFARLATGGNLGPNEVYVGRGGRGVLGSKWGNPFRLSAGVDRATAVAQFGDYLENSTALRAQLGELEGKDLLCHCGPEVPCHADVLLEAAAVRRDETAQGADDDHPVRVPTVRGEPEEGTVEAPSCGWHGLGPTRRARHMGGDRPYHDGGGLCSPGRWPPSRRRLPQCLPLLKDHILGQFTKAIREMSGGSEDPRRFMMRMCLGHFKECPFTEGALAEVRATVRALIDMPASEDVVAEGQVFHLALMSRLLQAYGDPDWEFVKNLADGVPLGVGTEMPRAPAVFEEKDRWRLAEEPEQGTDAQGNYQSVAPFLDQVRDLFKEEAAKGWMRELPVTEARALYGERLAIAALGVVDEGTKIRVIHDGSNQVLVNHKIRVRDQTRCPGAGELRTLIQERLARGLKSFAILGDVSKAHRRIKVKKEDWGLQACQLDPGTVWVNTVGTYGMGSAAYYWARFGAGVLVRLPHYVAGKEDSLEILLYVDDFLFLPYDSRGIVLAGALIFLLVALGVPLRWDKCRGGERVDWIGYWADLWGGQLGISERRATWLVEWMRLQVKKGHTELSEFTSVLGRLCFALGPLEHLRPFVAPLFAWVAARGHAGSAQLPWSVAFIFTLLAEELSGGGRVAKIQPAPAQLGMAFRADAKAEGMVVRIGGWECIHGTPPGRARWFAVDLDRVNAPWAFARGEPFRTIAALELFATLICVVVFSTGWPEGAQGAMAVQGVTDNAGNTFAVTRLMSSKFPLIVILAELAMQLRRRAVSLDLQWVPRDQNEEADALTNGAYGSFDPRRRLPVDPARIEWLVLPRLLEVSEALYKDIQELKSAKGAANAAPHRRAHGFRQANPW